MQTRYLRWLALFGAALFGFSAPAADTRDDPMHGGTNRVDYLIVVTGGELLHGAYPDSHTHFLTRTLTPLGLHCVGAMIVDDLGPDITEAVRFALHKAPLVIVTGGLGPTDNDITRQTLAAVTGVPLREHPDVLQEMARRFQTSQSQLRANLRRQTQVPTRGAYLKNPNGTAVGLVFELERAVVVALPGPPRELQPMVRAELIPYLTRRFGTRPPGCALTLRFVGLGQSQIDQTFKEHVPLERDIILSSQFEGGRVDFTFSLPGDSPPERARLRALENQILEHLGDNIYADDDSTLEDVVVRALQQRGATLALVESGSGGSLAAALSAADATGKVIAGGFVARQDDQARRLLQVPEPKWTNAPSSQARLKLLADAAQALCQANAAVVIAPTARDKAGAASVEALFMLPGAESSIQRLALRGSGEIARATLNTQVLDQLRRKLGVKVSKRQDTAVPPH